jgi:hypothetical protein
MLDSGNEIGIGNKGQIAECFIQVSRTDLAGSPRTTNFFRKANLLFFFHEHSVLFCFDNPAKLLEIKY